MSNVAAGTSPLSQPRPHFRFSLRELMGIIFGLALGLAAMRQSRIEWYEGLLVSAIYWIILGLARQIVDLRAALRGMPALSADLRTGGRFAITWRLIAIALLVGYGTLEALRRQGLLTMPEVEGQMIGFGEALRKLLFYFALIMVMASEPSRAKPAPAVASLDRILKSVAWPAALGLCLFAWISYIEHSYTFRFANLKVDFGLVARTRWFVIHFGLVAALVPLNMWLTCRLARTWTLAGRVPWKVIACLMTSLVAAAGNVGWFYYFGWYYAVGLPRFSPYFAESQISAPMSVWLTAALLTLLASAAASYRLISSFSEPRQTAALYWRREPRRYHHERFWTTCVLVVALGGKITAALYWLSNWRISLEFFLTWPENYVIVAAFWLAVCVLFQGFRRARESTDIGQPPLVRRQFAAVWLASLLTFSLSLPVLAWFCFSLWLLFG